MVLVYFLKSIGGSAADGAFLRWLTGDGIATDLADKIRLILHLLIGVKGFKRLLEVVVVDLLYLISPLKSGLTPLVFINYSLLNETRIHAGKLAMLTDDAGVKIFLG